MLDRGVRVHVRPSRVVGGGKGGVGVSRSCPLGLGV